MLPYWEICTPQPVILRRRGLRVGRISGNENAAELSDTSTVRCASINTLIDYNFLLDFVVSFSHLTDSDSLCLRILGHYHSTLRSPSRLTMLSSRLSRSVSMPIEYFSCVLLTVR